MRFSEARQSQDKKGKLAAELAWKRVFAVTGLVLLPMRSNENIITPVQIRSACSDSGYTTDFLLAENPISEGGKWVGGQSAGGNLWGDVQTSGGMAYGVSEPTLYGDPSAIITDINCGPNQTASAKVRIISRPTGKCCHEAEVRLRMTVGLQIISGYEVYCSVMTAPDNYCHIATWGGPNGVWKNLVDYTGPYSTLNDGDFLKGTISGNPPTITAWVNGNQIMQVTDKGQAGWGPWTLGSPGIGFYDTYDRKWSNFGFSTAAFTSP